MKQNQKKSCVEVISWEAMCLPLSCTFKVQQGIAFPSGLLPAALRDQTMYTYLAENSHSVSHGIL